MAAISGAQATLTAGNLLTTGPAGAINVGGSATLKANAINQQGALQAASAALTATTDLTSTGTITATNDATLTAANITRSGRLTADTATLNATSTLTNTGAITANTATLSAATINQQGTLTVDTATLAATGALTNAAGAGIGARTKATLSGNTVDQLGTVTAGTAIDITAINTATLRGGIEQSPLLTVTAPTINLIGGSILTGGVPQPTGVKVDQLPKRPTATLGAFFAPGSTFAQSGTTTLAPLPGFTDATVRISLTTGNGRITFGNFNAPQANLILDLGNGTAPNGGINVRNLFITYTGTNSANGSVDLTGTVNGQGGTAAASAGQISPHRRPELPHQRLPHRQRELRRPPPHRTPRRQPPQGAQPQLLPRTGR